MKWSATFSVVRPRACQGVLLDTVARRSRVANATVFRCFGLVKAFYLTRDRAHNASTRYTASDTGTGDTVCVVQKLHSTWRKAARMLHRCCTDVAPAACRNAAKPWSFKDLQSMGSQLSRLLLRCAAYMGRCSAARCVCVYMRGLPPRYMGAWRAWVVGHARGWGVCSKHQAPSRGRTYRHKY